MKILLGNGYFVEIDNLNHTLKQEYIGTNKAGAFQQYEKVHGYFSNLDSAVERYLILNQNDLMADSRIGMKKYLELVKEANEQAVQAVKAVVEATEDVDDEDYNPVLDKVTIRFLKELQQYRAIGTVEEIIAGLNNGVRTLEQSGAVIEAYMSKLEEYQSIGTVEELQALKEINSDCIIKHLTGECSYDETGCSGCESKEKIKVALEKSVAKKPIEQGTDDKTIYKCSCGNVLMEKYSDGLICGFITDYCKVCGQKLLRADVDWE